ncbi:hypothetical protein LC087_08385 [Bacillus carboniphilus]|uniref:Uncharacterized protein n=1 Tax=Bacillus carboniphilus TaxID=86663 RepID=A0ABY9K054_9BACI|nr:hypothetical protein [Bacillus carboniphilus]WLR44098.1 hypothetical protein LC087_08385 [Bacillus carboniphilus]
MNTQTLDMPLVLRAYQIVPQYINQYTDKVWKIQSNTGTYALKKVLNRSSLNAAIPILKQAGYHKFVPIYPSIDGQLYVVDQQGHSYYLMPWIQDNQKIDEKQKKRTVLQRSWFNAHGYFYF